MVLTPSIEAKLTDLAVFFKGKKIIVALSGGVDSSLMAFLAKQYAKDIIAITINSPLIIKDEIDQAKEFTLKHGIFHLILDYDPLHEDSITQNTPDRCYYCKTEIFKIIKKETASRKFDLIVDGSNIDDLSDHRPGMRALKELEIISPFIKYDINKTEIREIAEYFQLDIYLKPSMACLASRFSYGETLTIEKIKRVAEAEQYLNQRIGFSQLRIRYHQDDLARIEVLKEEMPLLFDSKVMSTITEKLKYLGFNYVTIDLEGFRSGSMNECLEKNKLKE